MRKKIIVAGGGHGGIAAAALLAKGGLDVTVYERHSKDQMGYDWTDIFGPDSLKIAGMEMPPADKFEYKENMTFYSPDQKTPARQNVAPDKLEIKMERRDIYAHIIAHAQRCGVKFVYDCNITAPILSGNRVIGIQTDDGDFYGDLVIDAAGLHSPIRTRMPLGTGIENEVAPFHQFFVYRGFYDRGDQGGEVQDKYKVFLLPQGKLGIAWVATEGDQSDLLIGRFAPFDMEEVKATADYLRQKSPSLGTKLKRGGQMVNIPVRQPLSVMVSDGYAAIGDAAFMTVPIIGSGIANSFKAARILADTVLEDASGAYSASTLWGYQLRYYKELGAGLAPLACLKDLLRSIDPADVDFLFAAGVLDGKTMTFGSDFTSLMPILKSMTPKDAVGKVTGLVKKPALIKKLLPLVAQIAKVMAVTAMIPDQYNQEDVLKWANQYLNIYR